MLCVAEGATQVAAAEAYENGGRSSEKTFALQGVEYFVYSVHSIKILRSIVLDVGSLVVARLPHIGAVAVRDSIHNPLGQVLGRRIEVQDLIDVGMVDLAVNESLDLGEVAYHTIAVELCSAAIHIDFPIVAVKVLAFALVVEVELVAG